MQEAEQLEVEQPEAEQPEVEQPEAEQPEVEQPEAEQPEVEQPEVEQQEAEQLDAEPGVNDALIVANKPVIVVKSLLLHRFKSYKNIEIPIPDGYCLLAGANNAGKSTFMQAFAVWEFCKSVITVERGVSELLADRIGIKQGLGISSEDFLPMNLPSLKHLWTNLKTAQDPREPVETDGYTLWIELGAVPFTCWG